MSQHKPTREVSYTKLRELTEKYRVLKDGKWTISKTFPDDCEMWEHLPFRIRAVSTKGEPMDNDNVICIGVNTKKKMRRIKYLDSGEIRWVYDYLILEINNYKILTH